MKLTHFLASLIAAQGVISAPTLGKKLCTQPGWHCFKGLTNMVNIAWKPAPVEGTLIKLPYFAIMAR